MSTIRELERVVEMLQDRDLTGRSSHEAEITALYETLSRLYTEARLPVPATYTQALEKRNVEYERVRASVADLNARLLAAEETRWQRSLAMMYPNGT